ncbi:MAG: permease [archaeon]|nr:permease [archaeon]
MDLLFLFSAGLNAILDYLLAHTLFCLVPAFFIAGAMSALIPKSALLPYLGKNSPKWVSYPLAVVCGLLLAVCSCTVLPLFAGIRKSGAGLGPAIAFLYTAPATNIIAIIYTGSLIGWDIAFARIGFSVLFAISIGLILARFFPEPAEKSDSTLFEKTGGFQWKRLFLLFAAMVGVLVAGTRMEETPAKYALVFALAVFIAWVAKSFFSREELGNWMRETRGFAKLIVPLLLVGVFASGVIRALIPPGFIATFFGTTSLWAVAVPVLFGVLVYFPTLVEVPLARSFLDLGMAKGPLLAYLLADPVISLPSILVVRGIMGTKRTIAYAVMVFVFSIGAGLLFGHLT